MSESFVSSLPIIESSLIDKMRSKGLPVHFSLEITARCNNNCRHCYINLPAGDESAREKEITFEEIKAITDEAYSLGTFTCLITGGEPFLRTDFPDIYMYLRKKGFWITVFTNATMITEKHIKLFKKYPPKNVEITVYGITRETYERVTRISGSFDAFMRGVNLLSENGIRAHFKTIAMRSNVHEMPEIAQFCRERTSDYYRFDPLLILRYDGDPIRNEEIKSERLSPEEIVEQEHSDSERLQSMQKNCDKYIVPEHSQITGNFIFYCAAGNSSFAISYDGSFRLCSSLCHPDCVYDLKKGNLAEALSSFLRKVRDIRSNRSDFLNRCRVCPLISLCMQCPAICHLETGELDLPVDYYCQIAHARAKALSESMEASDQRLELQ